MKINLEEAEPREPDWEGLEAAIWQATFGAGKPLLAPEDDILDAEFIE